MERKAEALPAILRNWHRGSKTRIAPAAIGWYGARHCGGSSRLMDAESHEKMVMVGMHRDRSYIPARSIGSKQKRIGVSGTIVAAAVVRVRVGNGGS